jgi:hypothetical protein
MRYKVLQRIWSPSEQCYYEAGAEISLDHLSEETRAALVGYGLVAEIPESDSDAPSAELTSGTIDLADGVDEAEARLAGRALRGRHKR